MNEDELIKWRLGLMQSVEEVKHKTISLHGELQKLDNDLNEFFLEWRGAEGHLGASQRINIIWHAYAWVYSIVSFVIGSIVGAWVIHSFK